MAYKFDPARTVGRLRSLNDRIREALNAFNEGRSQAAEHAAQRLLGEGAEVFDKAKSMQAALTAVRDALAEELGTDFFYVVEWGVDYLIYELETGQMFRREFKLKASDDGFEVTLKAATEVEQVWQSVPKSKPKKESATPVNGKVRLVETAREPVNAALLTEAGSAKIKIIAPGQGSSAFYPSEVLKRDGPKIFTRGTHMFMDHPSESEEMDRPERSNKDLAGVLESDALYMENGPRGPGLYADASVFEAYKSHLAEIAPYTGVSIRAMGAIDGDGNVTELTDALSVDFVTTPGAGGKIVQLFESARRGEPISKTQPEVTSMDQVEVKRLIDEARAGDAEALRELRESNARLQSQLIREAARNEAARILESVADMHPKAKALVIRNVTANPPMKDGGLDYDKFAEAVDAETKIVAAMVAEAAGTKPVTGVGEPSGATDMNEADIKAALVAEYVKGGMSETAAKLAAEGRVQ